MHESKSKKAIPYLAQKGIRSTIEEIITYCLDGELEKTALEFAEFMGESGMPFKPSVSSPRGRKVNSVCQIFFYGPDDWAHSDRHKPGDPAYWGISTRNMIQHDKLVVSEGLQHIYWDKVIHCIGCDSKCGGAKDVTILGKDFNAVCRMTNIHDFYNPDGATLEGLKQLIVLAKSKINGKPKGKQASKTPNPPSVKLTPEQKEKNVPVETLIPVLISDGDMKNTVADLVANLRERKLDVKRGGVSRWVVQQNKQQILSFSLGRKANWWCDNDHWYVDLTLLNLHKYEDSIIAIGLQDFVLNNMKHCVNCSLGCFPGKNTVIFNRELAGICVTKQFVFFCDPDMATIVSILKLLDFEMKERK